jgi:RimJ/RimL family protein N-acetyltransferase
MPPRPVVPTLTDASTSPVVTLRAHRDSDIPRVVEQSTDPTSIRWTSVPQPYGVDDAKRFVREAMPGGWASEEEWGFAVEVGEGGAGAGAGGYAGTVSLRNQRAGRAEVAFGSHPGVRGTGVMQRALRLLLDWGFTARDLQVVSWWANRGNWASRKLVWRLGFSFAGTVECWLPHRGRLVDGWLGTLHRDDPREPRTTWYAVPTLTGDKVVLRRHLDTDAARVQEACSDPRLRHWLPKLPDPYTRADAERFLRDRSEAMARGTGVHWMLADPEDDRLLGTISLFDLADGSAEVGYWAHPEARGRGLMTEAVGLVVAHAFRPAEEGGLGLRRLAAFVAVDNAASRHVVETVGFRQTGVQRAALRTRVGFSDLVGHDLLADDSR